MESLFYLYKTSCKNRVRKALHKPITYVYIAGIIAYLLMIVTTFKTMFDNYNLNSPVALVSILTVFVFITVPVNILSFSRRKGLIYKNSDVHFVFPSPYNPKKILLYAYLKQEVVSIGIGLFLTAAGIFMFHVSTWKMLLYFLFVCIIENILEAALMVILYGNEVLSDRTMKLINKFMYLLIFSFIAIAFLIIRQGGITVENILLFLQTPLIQVVPLIGWNIAIIHLIIVGPTAVNVVCSILYVLTAVVLVYIAVRIKCTGEYYEDAMKFADDYEEAKRRNKKGEAARIGKKDKYRKVEITYKGYYAKAIFYRQLLEYKKSKYFIFGFMTLLSLGVGVGIVVLSRYQDFTKMKEFILPGVMAYMILMVSTVAMKWEKDLESPYTYMIPDTAFHKLWYATLLEHFRSLINACLMTIPVAIALQISPMQAILSILLYVCLQGCKLYLTIMAEGLLGDLLGTPGKQMLRMLFLLTIMTVAILFAVAAYFIFGIEAAFLAMIVVVCAETLICMLVAAIGFEKMESLT